MSDTQHILDLYDNGLSLKQLSKRTGLSSYKIRKIIINTGRLIRQGNYQDLSLDSWQLLATHIPYAKKY